VAAHLSQLADLVFSIPTSSASSERAWSIFDYIHTKKRNRLSTEDPLRIGLGSSKNDLFPGDSLRHGGQIMWIKLLAVLQ
jgi:hypothetical protein